jgi:hypothetical protein
MPTQLITTPAEADDLMALLAHSMRSLATEGRVEACSGIATFVQRVAAAKEELIAEARLAEARRIVAEAEPPPATVQTVTE